MPQAGVNPWKHALAKLYEETPLEWRNGLNLGKRNMLADALTACMDETSVDMDVDTYDGEKVFDRAKTLVEDFPQPSFNMSKSNVLKKVMERSTSTACLQRCSAVCPMCHLGCDLRAGHVGPHDCDL